MLLVTEQLLEALAAAHAAGIVHRDLKPENLFLTTEGRLKVLDFGIARLAEDDAHGVGSAPSGQTRPGSLLGTPAFMAPEQACGRWSDVDHRTDLWAVGATMFTLLTGEHVHEAETVNLQLAHAAMLEARPIAERFPLPARVAAIVDRALRFEKRDRWQSAIEMLEAVRAVLLEEPESGRQLPRSSLVSVEAETLAVPLTSERFVNRPSVSSVSAATTALSATPRKPKRTLALAGVALALLIVGSVAILWRSTESEQPPVSSAPAPVLAPARTPTPEPEGAKLESSIPAATTSVAPRDAGASRRTKPVATSKPKSTASDDDLYEKRY
jgi:serine/threonine-protein kinase